MRSYLIFFILYFWYGFNISIYATGLDPLIFESNNGDKLAYYPYAIVIWLINLFIIIAVAIRIGKRIIKTKPTWVNRSKIIYESL